MIPLVKKYFSGTDVFHDNMCNSNECFPDQIELHMSGLRFSAPDEKE